MKGACHLREARKARRGRAATLLLLLAVGCDPGDERSDERARDMAPPPLTLEVDRLAPLDSALAQPGLTLTYHWEAADSMRGKVSVTAYPDPRMPGTITLLDSIALDLSSVERSSLGSHGNTASVSVRLKRDAMPDLLRTTTWHQGEQIGVVLNGRLIGIATVKTPFASTFPVVTDIPPAQALELAERIEAVLSEPGSR